MAATAENLARLEELQYKMYADERFAMLVALQAIDGGGKDSTIRRVFGAFNPQGCTVTAFKAPSAEELRHDYLWRIHQHAPPRGEIAVFNRSHYEDVLIVRVNDLVPEDVWSRRYEQINEFERLLDACGTRVVKIFLQISKEEQRVRFAGAAHRQAQELEIRYRRSGEAAAVGRLHAGVRGDVCAVLHRTRALVRSARKSQMVPRFRGLTAAYLRIRAAAAADFRLLTSIRRLLSWCEAADEVDRRALLRHCRHPATIDSYPGNCC